MVKFIYGSDTYNDFRGRKPNLDVCPVCDVVLHPYSHGFPGKLRPKTDLSVTSESIAVASPRLRELLDEHCTSEIEYFETGGGFFVLRPRRVVFIDLRETNAEYLGYCNGCGRYQAYHGLGLSKPRLLAEALAVGPFDLVRSHQEFGPHKQRNFDLIAGDGLVDILKSSRLKGIFYNNCD